MLDHLVRRGQEFGVLVAPRRLRENLHSGVRRVEVRDWAYGNQDKMAEAGFPHETELELTDEGILAAAGKLFAAGMNVMLLHFKEGTPEERVIIYVDDRRFSQR